ncbi:hypothetical protein NCS52_01164500 [Fusarium sp. LHS14.1]|nr:hypothetical protein NCS52_01164500 [Fusarium sp. LHS14.1]
MTYSSSGPSLAQALDMDVDPSPSALPLASSSSSPSSSSSDLPGSASASHHSRSASHPHYHARSNSANDQNENDDDTDDSHSHSHVHRAHIHLHHLRDTTVDANGHDQLHNDGHHSHHSHHLLHRRKTPPNLDIHVPQDGSAPANDLKPRAEDNLVTQVVQTVSLVQVVDSVGSPIELQTHIGAPATVVVDSASGVTVAISNPDPSPSVAAAASNPAATYNVPPASSDTAPAVETDTPDMTDPEPSTLLPDATASQSYPVPDAVSDTTLAPTSDVQSITSGLPETSAAPTSSEPETTSQETASTEAPSSAIDTTSELSGSQNATTATATTEDLTTTSANPTTLTDITTDLTSEATSEATTDASATESSDTSVLKQSLSTTNTPQTGSSSTITIVSSTFITSSIEAATTDASQLSLSDSIYSSIADESWTSTWWGGDYSEGGDGGGYGGDSEATAQAQPPAATTTAASNDTESGTLSPQQKQVIGGVVGSVAGVAFLALLVMFAFRYKRKHTSGLLGENQAGTRAIGGPGGESGGAMAERAGGFSVAAALASLAGKKQAAPEPEPTGERGFYRVSGKKLPSVLQVGGDGYSDPRTNRESVMSGHSDYWRGSMAFDPGDRDSNRLALGSPMRPVSGVPVIRTGPARTPITESNPFTDPPPARPRPDSDALGGSVGGGSQDGSVGSPPSRFRERI